MIVAAVFPRAVVSRLSVNKIKKVVQVVLAQAQWDPLPLEKLAKILYPLENYTPIFVPAENN